MRNRVLSSLKSLPYTYSYTKFIAHHFPSYVKGKGCDKTGTHREHGCHFDSRPRPASRK